jgi:hypothetical protein
MQAKQNSASFAVSLLVAVLLLPANATAAPALPQSGAQQTSPPSGVRVDPSAGPLQPSAAQPSAPLPSAPQPAAAATPVPQPSPPAPAQPAPQEPLGAAAAEQIRTAGGGASRPAGNAIAPVKQRRYRSLAIKLGAAAAVGIAAGTVYGLSRATSSTPPHSAAAATR